MKILKTLPLALALALVLGLALPSDHAAAAGVWATLVIPRGVPLDSANTQAVAACPADGATNAALAAPMTAGTTYVLTVLSDTVYVCPASATCETGGVPFPAGSVSVLTFDRGTMSCRSVSGAGALHVTPAYAPRAQP